MSSSSKKIKHCVMWKNLLDDSIEFCNLITSETENILEGTVVLPQSPISKVEYQVTCNQAWETESVRLTVQQGLTVNQLYFDRSKDGIWRSNLPELPVLENCVDVDLGITPATNTLPIRRLNLEIGASQEVVATWIRFPDLSIQPLKQEYTRLTENVYRYSSRDGQFVTRLEVDTEGVVVDYPDIWERVG